MEMNLNGRTSLEHPWMRENSDDDTIQYGNKLGDHP